MIQKEQMIRTKEKESFERRSRVILDLLNIPRLSPIFASVGEQPRVLELYAGTGAGGQAVYDRLAKLGKKPKEITMVDVFLPLIYDRLSEDWAGDYARQYASGIDETKRNMETVSNECTVNVCKANALDCLKSVVKAGGPQLRSQPPFDLIAGFSVEDVECSLLIEDKQLTLPFMMRIIDALGNIPTMFTYGKNYDENMEQLNSYLQKKSGKSWNLYAKPQEAGNPNWDKWILTNRQLDLERFEETTLHAAYVG